MSNNGVLEKAGLRQWFPIWPTIDLPFGVPFGFPFGLLLDMSVAYLLPKLERHKPGVSRMYNKVTCAGKQRAAVL